jgi:hypothetical protein
VDGKRKDRHKEPPVSIRLPAALLAWLAAQDRPRQAVIIEAIEEKRARES